MDSSSLIVNSDGSMVEYNSLLTQSQIQREPEDTVFSFRRIPLQKRQKMFAHLISKFGGLRVPVILGVREKDQRSIKLTNEKFLVDGSATFGMFLHTIRTNMMSGNKNEAFYLATREGWVLPLYQELSIIAERHRDKHDGFLYFIVMAENCFGWG